MILVVVVESPSGGAHYELAFDGAQRVTLGREPQCDVQLPHASVSLLHASVRSTESGYVLVDEKSTNGTVLNGRRLQRGEQCPLAEEDRLELGKARLRIAFRAPSVSGPTGLSPSTQDIALAIVKGELSKSGTGTGPVLSVLEGPATGAGLALEEDRSYSIGSAEEADLRLLDLAPDHVRVQRRGARLWLTALEEGSPAHLDGASLVPHQPQSWPDTALLQIGPHSVGIDDPVRSALREVQSLPDERLEVSSRGVGIERSPYPGGGAARSAQRGPGGTVALSEPPVSDTLDRRWSLSTSSSSAAPASPIEVLRERDLEPAAAAGSRRVTWSTMDVVVVLVAAAALTLTVIALAWFVVG